MGNAKGQLSRAWFKSVIPATGICLAILLAYSNSFGVPFLFDDAASLAGVEHLYQDSIDALKHHFGEARIVGYYTFKLNYDWAGFDVFGFHLVNTLVHVLNGLVVYQFALMAYRVQAANPMLAGAAGKIGKAGQLGKAGRARQPERAGDYWLGLSKAYWFALAAALVFVLHPLQSQAVTYIVQRLASLVALWYLLALSCYLGMRIVSSWVLKIVLLALGVSFGFLAFYTKQNAFTLPLAVLLIEIVLLQRWRLPLWSVVLVTLGLVGSVWAVLHYLPQFPELDKLLTETRDFSRWQYYETQLGVLLLYLKLYLLPYGQQVEIIYPLADGTFAQSWVLVATHVAVLGAGIYSIGRRPWLAFGILFFYLTHTVESGFVPISDLAFEHRMYLPSFGLALALASLLLQIKLPRFKVVFSSFVLVLIVLTYQRNALWAEPIKLMQSELAANFNKPRVHAFLGDLYRDEGAYDKAAESYRNAFELVGQKGDLDNQGYEQRYSFLNNYVANLGRSGQYQKAIGVASEFLDEVRTKEHRWALTNNIGYMYYDLQDYNQCLINMMSAIGINPNRHESFVGAGLCFYYMDRREESLMMFTNGLAMAPDPDGVRDIMRKLGLLD